MATQLKLFNPDATAYHGGNKWKPPRIPRCGPGGCHEDDGPPPETRAQRVHRLVRLRCLLKRFCPPKVLRILLRWAEGEENFCSIGRILGGDRRSVKKAIARELDRLLGCWLRHLAETAHAELLRNGEVVICPWIIQVLGCPHTHGTAADAVCPGTGSVEAIEAFVREHQALLFDGPPNAHLALWYDNASDRTHVAVQVHRRHAVALPVNPSLRLAA